MNGVRRLVVGAGLAAVMAACARIAAPPGGPPDFAAPRLLGTVPESVAVLPGFDGWAEFRFDEVVSEGSQPNFGYGSGDLERLVLVSPDTAVPQVRWHRDRISVRPRDGWRPNTVYRVELAAGITDIAPRRNSRDTAAVITFTTGAPLPTRTLTGRGVDWLSRRFASRALVEVMLLPDSLVYRTVTDSSGRFRIGPLPDGSYLVSVILDANSNRRRDAREGWDSVRIEAGRDSVGEVWAFQRDTVPPRVAQGGASQKDSFAIALNLTQPVDPSLHLGPEAISVFVAPDSTRLPPIAAVPAAAYDSIFGPIDSTRRAIAAEAQARADSARADSAGVVPDTAATPPPPPPVARPGRPGATRPGREGSDTTPRDEPKTPHPILDNRLVIRLSAILQPGTRYLIELRGVRAMSGQVADTLRTTLEIPARPKPKVDSTATPADSAAADSAKVTPPADTTRPRHR